MPQFSLYQSQYMEIAWN